MDSIKTSKLINPQAFGGLISPVSSVDANSYTVSGIHYLTTGCSHVPENYVYLIVNATSQISVSQIAIAYSSQKVYCRSLSSGSWSAWTEISFHNHGHAWSEITSKPDSFPPASHSHGASDITSGTLAVARGGTGKSAYASTNYTSVEYRGERFASSDTTPTDNGTICWTYE